MGDNFLSKSFLFEVVDSKTQKIDASFTLVLPPNAYTVREKHRVNITKTFGNAFIDDYGPDNLELTIKGISGTAHVFPTFRTKGVSSTVTTFGTLGQLSRSFASEGYRHKEAFYAFRDEIMRYKDKFIDSFDRKELRVFDLGDEQAYRCVLLEFTVDRTADKPMHYPFTISLFVYQKMGSKESYKPKKINIARKPMQVLDAIENANNSLNERFKVFQNVQNIRNTLGTLQAQTVLLRSRFNTWMTKTRLVVESPLLITKQLLSTVGNLGGILYDAYTQGKLTINTWANAKETINDQIQEILGAYGYSIQEGAQQIKEQTVATKTGMDYSTATEPVPTSETVTFAFNGVNLYVVKAGDTLQSIAQSQLGDNTLWPFIASINQNILSNNDLYAGLEIYVPISVLSGGTNKDNFILTEDAYRNPYGTDIKIDREGDIILLESNDVATINGINNVLQAIDLRLKTQIGSMITQTAYGLISQPGLSGTAQALSYIRMNFVDALMQDPRIADVKNVRISLEQDAVQCGADIYLVGYETSLPVSTLLS